MSGLGTKRTKVLTVFPTVAGGESPMFTSSSEVPEKARDNFADVISVFPAGGQGYITCSVIIISKAVFQITYTAVIDDDNHT